MDPETKEKLAAMLELEPTLDHTVFLLTLLSDSMLHPELTQACKDGLAILESDTIPNEAKALTLTTIAKNLTTNRRHGYERVGILLSSATPHLAPGALGVAVELVLKTHIRAALVAFGGLMEEAGEAS